MPLALSLKVGILNQIDGLGFQTQQALLIIGGNGMGLKPITRSLHAPMSSNSSCCFPRGETGSGENPLLLYFALLGIQETVFFLI